VFHVEEKLDGQLPPEMAREIDQFEAQMILRKANKIEDRVFRRRACAAERTASATTTAAAMTASQTQPLHFPNRSDDKGRRRVGTRRACSASRFRSAR